VSAEERLGNSRAPGIVITPADEDSDAGHKIEIQGGHKKHWYQFKRPRPRSEGSQPPLLDEEEIPSSAEPGRSFVVIRGHKPPPPVRSSNPVSAQQRSELAASIERPNSVELGSVRGHHVST